MSKMANLPTHHSLRLDNISSLQNDAAKLSHARFLTPRRRRRRLHIGSSSANAGEAKKNNPTSFESFGLHACAAKCARPCRKKTHATRACMHSSLPEKRETPPEHITDDRSGRCIVGPPRTAENNAEGRKIGCILHFRSSLD